MARPPATPSKIPPNGKPKLKSVSKIGRLTLVKGARSLANSEYRKLLEHPQTKAIFEQHGIANADAVIRGLKRGEPSSLSSLEQGRRIFKALKAVAAAHRDENIKQSVFGRQHKPGQLVKQAQALEGPTPEQVKAEQEKMKARARADRRQEILYAQAKSRAQSSISERTVVAEPGRDARSSVAEEPRSTIFDKPDQPTAKGPAPSAPTDSRPVQLTGGTIRTEHSPDQPAAPTPAGFQATETGKPKAAKDEPDAESDLTVPPPADDEGLPL